MTDAETWRNKRRGEILELFREHVYGRSPGKPDEIRYETLEATDGALDGKATRKQVRVHFSEDVRMDILLYLPADATGPPGCAGRPRLSRCCRRDPPRSRA